MRRRDGRRLAHRLWTQVRPFTWHLALLLALSILASPLALLAPVPLKIVVDNVLAGRRLPPVIEAILPGSAPPSPSLLLAACAMLIVLVGVAEQLRDYAASMLSAWIGERMLRDFRAEMFRHVQRLSLGYHDSKGTADSTYRIQYDATSLPNIATDGIVPLIGATLTLVSMVYVTARISPRLSLVALGVTPLLLVITQLFRRKLRRQAHEIKALESASLGVVSEALAALRVVKAFTRESHEEQRFRDRAQRSMDARIRRASSEGGFGVAVTAVTCVGMAAALLVGVREVERGALTLGALLLVMGYLSQLYSPLKTLGKKTAGIQGHLAGAERAFDLLDEAPDVAERADPLPIARARGELELRHVAFAYDGKRRVLDEVSLRIGAGSAVGIIGPTGAGKTTVVNLLNRFYDVTEGAVLLDGRDVRDYRVKDLRNQFALVLQEPVLFSASIAENIAYARPDATLAEIIAAATAAYAHEFITALPDGYDTKVGERGMTLSGGERQRISLARAFLKDAPILVLDEPTSAVDVTSEASIIAAMETLMTNRTTVIITHRMSMLRHCSQVLVLEGGHMRTSTEAVGT